jgi:hypothetical protein
LAALLTEVTGAAGALLAEAGGSAMAVPTATPLPPMTSAATVARPARRTRCVVLMTAFSSRLSLTAQGKPGAAQARWYGDGDHVEER